MKQLAAIFLLASTAYAGVALATDPTIQLRSGSLDFERPNSGDGPVSLYARQFSFEGFAQSTRIDAVDCTYGCEPRETFSLYAFAGGLFGVVELEGETYTDVGGLNSIEWISLEITGTGMTPREGARDGARRIFPVDLVGSFYHSTQIPLAPVMETIVAKAKAIVTYTKYISPYDGEIYWCVTHLTYKVIR